MLNYSFSTVLMAVIATNVLLVLITLFFLSKRIMVNMGYRLLSLFIGLTALRFLLPFEFPFTATVPVSEFLSLVISQIRRPFCTLGTVDISAWSIFQVVWIAGVLFNFIKYIREHLKAGYFILANSLDATDKEPYVSLVDKICTERKRKNRFQILTVNGISKPMLYGVFRPRILIPENTELSSEDLYYSLVHEISHHSHGDLLIKKLIRLISIAYWWNPICYILIKKVDVILEMRVDNVITASGAETVAAYLHSLLEIAERAADTEANALSKSVTVSLLSDDEGDLTQRYYMMTSAGQKKNHALNVLLLILMLGIYTTSHLFIFEADYVTPEVEATSVENVPTAMYAIIKEDGTYDIYYQSTFLENVESLEYYTSDIPIYTEKEISNEKH